MVMYIVLIVLFAAAIAADLYDIKMTVTGIAKGVGIEANAVVTTLAGTNKPSFLQLLLINMFIPILPFGVAGLAFGYDNPPVACMFAICLAFQTYSHWRGGQAWLYLLRGGNPNAPKTWWQKLFNL